jgi:hypothetical protein
MAFLVHLFMKKMLLMTSRLQRGDRLFNSGLAHSSFIFIYFQVNNINNFITRGRDLNPSLPVRQGLTEKFSCFLDIN